MDVICGESVWQKSLAETEYKQKTCLASPHRHLHAGYQSWLICQYVQPSNWSTLLGIGMKKAKMYGKIIPCSSLNA